MNLRLATINKEIKAKGGNEVLVKGDGYFYFTDGNAHKWDEKSVYVFSLNQLTLDEWIEIWQNFTNEFSE